MSNPVASIGNVVPQPVDPTVTRITYTRIVYEAQSFYVYAIGEYDPSYTTFDPTGKGERFYMFVPLADTLSATKPSFVSTGAWELVQKSASGFVTPVRSVMPKIIVPSDILVDNGVITTNEVFVGTVKAGGSPYDLFNWEVTEYDGTAPPSSDVIGKIVQPGAFSRSQYISVKAKNDTEKNNEYKLKLALNPAGLPQPPGSSFDWWSLDDMANEELIVIGAFCMMLNFEPTKAATEDNLTDEFPWDIKLEFGDVTLEISETGSCKATVAGESGGNSIVANLSDAKAKEGPPQTQHIQEKSPYVILVYQVWNGIVIASGVQDARGRATDIVPVLASSYFVPKLKEASIMEEPYSNGFDPTNPEEVFVTTDGGAAWVDFGTELLLTARNTRFEVSWQPCFFSKRMFFDEWFASSDDIDGVVSFLYDVYPIWTDNDTGRWVLGSVAVGSTSWPGPVSDTTYKYVPWDLAENLNLHDRQAGELFGSILRVTEEREFPVKNDNGNFNLSWSGGTPGDPSNTGDWRDYVQSISVTTSTDGSSGSLTVDKYGIGGQTAEAVQDIGAITIDMTGGFGTVAGTIFEGLALGIGDSRSSDGATWSIPIVGLEKKMEDIALINVPFFDGETLNTAIDFLTRYAGIIPDTSQASPFISLSASEDVNVARFDWTSGTSVRAALEEVMTDALHLYVVEKGLIKFYSANGITGLPNYTGTNWEPSYPDTKVIMFDQTPDFEDLKNEIVVLGLEQDQGGKGTQIEELPVFPRIALRNTVTTPDFPWAKSRVTGIPGYHTQDTLDDQADKQVAESSSYITIGRTSIPGNASINIYDLWGDFVITTITHNIDLVAKTWTTDLEFVSA